MRSEATSVADYITSLPLERQQAVEAICKVVRQNLPKGYEEAMNWGMITWQVPLSIAPDTYNGQPLAYAALASQKNKLSFYFMCDGGEGKLATIWANPKKKPDMGKSCLRFASLADLNLSALGKLVASVSVAEFVSSFRR